MGWQARDVGLIKTRAVFKAGMQEDVLDLALRGFEQDHVERIGLAGEHVWTASRNVLRHFTLSDPARVRAFSFAADQSPRFKRLNGQRYAVIGQQAYTLSERDNPQEIAVEADTLWSGTHWRVDRSGQVAYRRTANARWLDLKFDAKTGFAIDQPQRLCVTGQLLIVSTPAGIFRGVLPLAGQSLALADLAPVPGLDAVDEFWVAHNGEAWARPTGDREAWQRLDDKQNAWQRVGPLPAEQSAAYSELARKGSLRCRRTGGRLELVEELARLRREVVSPLGDNGRFDFETVTAATQTQQGLWLATAAGLLRFRSGSTGLTFVDARALPPEKNERTLIDTPLWTWKRTASGELKVVVKPADQAALDAPLGADGRFAFDDAAACLADGDSVWFAGRNGVVRQKVADGSILHWYRHGTKNSQAQPLPPLALLGRFDERGMPVPSSASSLALTAATHHALDAQGNAWKLDGRDPGKWVFVDKNPWKANDGRWLARTPSLEIADQGDGAIRLIHPGDEQGPVLRDGRFLADVVRAVAFDRDSGFVATAAGIGRIDPRSGTLRRLWRADLAGCDHVAAAREGGRVYASAGEDKAFVFDATKSAWSPVPTDARLKETAEVLFENDFWSWPRWRDGVAPRLLKGGPLLLAGGEADGFEVQRLDAEGTLRKRYEVLRGVPLHLEAVRRDEYAAADPLSVAGVVEQAWERRHRELAALDPRGYAVPTSSALLLNRRDPKRYRQWVTASLGRADAEDYGRRLAAAVGDACRAGDWRLRGQLAFHADRAFVRTGPAKPKPPWPRASPRRNQRNRRPRKRWRWSPTAAAPPANWSGRRRRCSTIT